MFQLVHEVPGRVRLIGTAHDTDALVRQLEAIPGVSRVVSRSSSNSVIVFHDRRAMCRDAVLACFGISASLPAPLHAMPPLLDRVIQSVTQQLLEQLTRVLITAVF